MPNFHKSAPEQLKTGEVSHNLSSYSKVPTSGHNSLSQLRMKIETNLVPHEPHAKVQLIRDAADLNEFKKLVNAKNSK